MLKLIFILIVPIFLGSCGQKSVSKNDQLVGNVDRVDNFDLSDTTAKVVELISQNRTPFSMLDKLPDFLTKYIEKGYAPLDTSSGDLNEDGVRDFFLATYKIGEDTINPSPKRNLKILLGQQNGSYKLECESWHAIAPLDMGGFHDPYPGIISGKGKFVIQFYGGSNWKGANATTFEYSPVDKDWLQILVINESYFMDKRHYQSDTTTPKQFGRVTFKRNYCR
jgi:hypothetical protein